MMGVTGEVGEPISLEALVRHVSRLTEDLESVWMDALDHSRRTAANERLIAEWSAVAIAVNELTRGLDARLEAGGEDPRLHALPPFASELSNLQVHPEPAQELLQARMAMLLAFEQAARAIGALTGFAEAGGRIRSEGDVEWESNAFSACRERSELLLRLVVRQEEAERKALGSARVLPSATPPGLARLALAAVAWGHSDAEAAVVHLHLAARLIISDLLGTAPGELPPDLAQTLSERPVFVSVARMLRLAQGVVDAVAAGVEPDLTIATLLVPNLLGELSALVSQPPLAALRNLFPDPTAQREP
jgi:HEPN domain-containing protein